MRAETDRCAPGTVLDSDLAELNRLIEALRSVFAEANLLHERRGLHLSQTLEGVFYRGEAGGRPDSFRPPAWRRPPLEEGRLDPEGGSLLRTALEACSGPRAREDERSPSQRRAGALVELARQQLDGRGGRCPGRLDCGQPLGVEAVRRIACDAVLSTVLLGAAGEPLSVGRSRRVVSGALRRALVARDGAALSGLRPAGGLDGRPPPGALGGRR